MNLDFSATVLLHSRKTVDRDSLRSVSVKDSENFTLSRECKNSSKTTHDFFKKKIMIFIRKP